MGAGVGIGKGPGMERVGAWQARVRAGVGKGGCMASKGVCRRGQGWALHGSRHTKTHSHTVVVTLRIHCTPTFIDFSTCCKEYLLHAFILRLPCFINLCLSHPVLVPWRSLPLTTSLPPFPPSVCLPRIPLPESHSFLRRRPDLSKHCKPQSTPITSRAEAEPVDQAWGWLHETHIGGLMRPFQRPCKRACED